jgi:hypothetical protein
LLREYESNNNKEEDESEEEETEVEKEEKPMHCYHKTKKIRETYAKKSLRKNRKEER